MQPKLRKIFAFLLCFLLCFEQCGFTQVAGQLDISGHLAALRNSFAPDVFRPLHLRYLSYNPQENNFQLFLDKGSFKNPNAQELEDTTKVLLNYFFVGISLPNDKFWVNLRPDAEDNIIDNQLAQTDVGKIFLESDLQLKKDTARFTSPETLEGKEYWDKLYQKAGEIFGSQNITIPTLTRPWIVPDEIIIRETTDSAYIYKATLKVMLEQDYLKDSAVYNFKDDRLKELNEYSSQLIREIIIPKLNKEVNSSKRYAPLRQVYYSLIMAQWFKARFANKDGLYSRIIDRNVIFPALYSKELWSKTTYFKEYQKSFKDGEYNIQEPIQTIFGQTIRSYFSGGIQLVQGQINGVGDNVPKGQPFDLPATRKLKPSSGEVEVKAQATDEVGEISVTSNETKALASSEIKRDFEDEWENVNVRLNTGQEMTHWVVARIFWELMTEGPMIRRDALELLSEVTDPQQQNLLLDMARSWEDFYYRSNMYEKVRCLLPRSEETASQTKTHIVKRIIVGLTNRFGRREKRPKVPEGESDGKYIRLKDWPMLKAEIDFSIPITIQEALRKYHPDCGYLLDWSPIPTEEQLRDVLRGLEELEHRYPGYEINLYFSPIANRWAFIGYGAEGQKLSHYGEEARRVFDRQIVHPNYEKRGIQPQPNITIHSHPANSPYEELRTNDVDKLTAGAEKAMVEMFRTLSFIVGKYRGYLEYDGDGIIGEEMDAKQFQKRLVEISQGHEQNNSSLLLKELVTQYDLRWETDLKLTEADVTGGRLTEVVIEGDGGRIVYDKSIYHLRWIPEEGYYLIVTGGIPASDNSSGKDSKEIDAVPPSRITDGFTLEGRFHISYPEVVESFKKSGRGMDESLIVVDMGIGKEGAPTTFELANVFRKAGFSNVRIYGVDNNPEFVTVAKEKLGRTQPIDGITIEFIVGRFDLSKLGLDNIDMIISSNTLTYYTTEEQEIARKYMLKALDDRGWLVVVTGIDDIGTECQIYSKKGMVFDNITVSEQLSSGDLSHPHLVQHKIDSSPSKPGGIDFRSLPIVTQAITNLSTNINSLSLSHLSAYDLDGEWRQIQNLVNSGIIPSAERIKEYVQASCYNGSADRDIDKVISCISDILRLEEERYSETEPMLKDILVVIESASSIQQLKAAFIGTTP